MRAGICEIEDLWYTYLNSACPAVVDMYLDRVSYRVDTRRRRQGLRRADCAAGARVAMRSLEAPRCLEIARSE